MTESFLVQISNVIAIHANYCILCLRTDKERRLESPKHLKKFLESMGQRYAFIHPFQKVCFLCERQAALANRLFLASGVSIRAHTLVDQMKSRPSQFSLLAKALQDDVAQTSHPYWLRQMLDCETKFRRQRAKTQLLQTEVLQLSSDTFLNVTTPIANNDTFSLQTDGFSTQPCESRDSCVLPDVAARNAEYTCDLNNRHKILESIIILDEDDIEVKKDPAPTRASRTICDPKKTRPRSDPQIAPRNDLQIQPRNDLQIQPRNDPQIQPRNDPQIEPRNDPDNSSKPEKQFYIALPDTNTENDGSSMNLALHPIVFNNGLTVPSLSATFRCGQLVDTGTNIPIQIPQIAVQAGENISFISDANEIYFTLKKLSQIKTMDEVTCDSVSDKNTFKFIQNVMEPKLRSERIDWEDKIPMDVISFFDEENERDVCYKRPRLTMPEIGIRNVKSLSAPPCAVVDLCSGPELGGGDSPPLAPLAPPRGRPRETRKALAKYLKL